ncbi:MAG: hypothetical protein V1894_04350, partial [Chloroflexota bacterium]
EARRARELEEKTKREAELQAREKARLEAIEAKRVKDEAERLAKEELKKKADEEKKSREIEAQAKREAALKAQEEAKPAKQLGEKRKSESERQARGRVRKPAGLRASKGNVNIIITEPVTAEQISEFEAILKKTRNLRIVVICGSVSEIMIVVAPQQPIDTLATLRGLPIVANAQEEEGNVIVTLRQTGA